MSYKDFNSLSLRQKVSICFVNFVSTLAGGYYLLHWYEILFAHVQKDAGKDFSNLITVLILVVWFVIVTIVVVLGSAYIINITKRGLKTGNEQNLKDITENGTTKIETYTSDEGLGEIEFYWGDRRDANEDIKKILQTTKSNKIFISAIGFNTVTDVLSDSGVLDNFTTLLTQSQSAFRIIVVFPNEADIRLRPDKSERELQESIDNCIAIFKNFKKNISEKAIAHLSAKEAKDFNIDNHLAFYNYNNHIIPRHFILQTDDSILVGSYLSHQKGSKSYLMKLRNSSGEHQNPGLYNLFLKEINYIIEHTTLCAIT